MRSLRLGMRIYYCGMRRLRENMSQPSDLNELREKIKKELEEEKERKLLKKAILEQRKQIEQLAQEIKSISELKSIKDLLAEMAKKAAKVDELESKLSELEQKVSHKHEFVDEGDGTLKCKSCDYTVKIPSSYKKLETTKDLFNYLFKPHRHGEQIFDNVLDCPHCRTDLQKLLAEHGWQFETRGDEIRVRKKK